MQNNVTYKLTIVFHFNLMLKYPLNNKKQLTQHTEKPRIKICPPHLSCQTIPTCIFIYSTDKPSIPMNNKHKKCGQYSK